MNLFRGMRIRRVLAKRSRKCGRDLDTEVGCAATMIVVKDGFVDKEMLVEVEVDSLLEV